MILTPCPWMADTLQSGHSNHQAESLLVLLHGWGARAEDMDLLAQTLGSCRPHTLTLAPQGFEPATIQTGARQWFEVQGMTPQTRALRIAAVLPRLAAWIREAQRHCGVHSANTVLAGFSQGASLSIELAIADDALVTQVLAFSGRLPPTPTPGPTRTRMHLFTGALDPLLPVEDVQASVQRFNAAGGQATLDMEENLGHGINHSLLSKAVQRMKQGLLS